MSVSLGAYVEDLYSLTMKALNKIIANIPIANPIPIRTFIPRTKEKVLNIQWRNPRFQLIKAARVISNDNKIVCLEFNRTTVLSKKGDIIAVPNDDYMPKRIALFGYWDRELSIFLASGISRNSALLDLGAHCGLIALQTYNLSFVPKIYAVEPKESNLIALRRNFQKFGKGCDSTIIEAAVTEKHSESGYLYTERGATMNSSINPNLPGLNAKGNSEIELEEIKTIKETTLCKNFLAWIGNSDIALKSDLQGMDVIILSRFSDIFWSKVSIGSIEICSVSYASVMEINLLITHLKRFQKIFLDTKLTKEIGFSELSKFYLSKTNKAVNIFFIKK